MDHDEFTDTGVIGNPARATAEKGEEAFRRYAEHVARAVGQLLHVEVERAHARVPRPGVVGDLCDHPA